jgi:hypothetical protein
VARNGAGSRATGGPAQTGAARIVGRRSVTAAPNRATVVGSRVPAWSPTRPGVGLPVVAAPEFSTAHDGVTEGMYLDGIEHLATATKLERPFAEYVRRNVLVTPSGTFSQRYRRWAIEVVGVERILFSTDYPFRWTPHSGSRRFLGEADISDLDRVRIASGNWDRLCADIRRQPPVPRRFPPCVRLTMQHAEASVERRSSGAIHLRGPRGPHRGQGTRRRVEQSMPQPAL